MENEAEEWRIKYEKLWRMKDKISRSMNVLGDEGWRTKTYQGLRKM